MDTIIDQIQGTYDAGFPYAALMMALALPDICATLEMPPGVKTGHVARRYASWFDRYLKDEFPFVSGADLYAMRNGVMHSGRLGKPYSQFDRVIFVVHENPKQSQQGNIMMNMIGDPNQHSYLKLDALQTCRSIIAAVRQWEVDVANNGNVRQNAERLVQFYPTGFPRVTVLPTIG